MSANQPEDETPSRQQQQSGPTTAQVGGVPSRERRARSNRTWQQMQYMDGHPDLTPSDEPEDSSR